MGSKSKSSSKRKTTKKPDPKKLARVLDKARKQANRTGNTDRIERISKGIQSNKKYTVKIIDSALKQSSFNSIASIVKRRGDKIGAILTDTAQDIRTTYKLNYLKTWTGSDPTAKAKASKPTTKPKARKTPRRANRLSGRTAATNSLKTNFHKANPKLKTTPSNSLLKTVGRKALSAIPAVGLGALVYDVATSGAHTAKQVNRDLANNKKADAARKERVKAAKGSLFQRALDFDVVEYFSGDSSGKPKAKAAKTVSLSGAIKTKKSVGKTKTTTKKRPSKAKISNETRRKRFITVKKKGGGTFKRKNPHYGK